MAGNSVHLANAYVSLSVNAKGLRGDVDKQLGAATTGAGKKHGKTLGSRLAGGFKTAAKVGFAGAGIAAGAALAKGFGRLKGIDDAEGKLRGLGHSTKNVDRIMGDALASVKGTAFGLDEAATTAAGSVAAGVKPGKELKRNLTLVGDAATIAGVGMGEMGSIFNKVASTDMIQGDVLAQLGDQGIPILQFLSKELGVSAGEVKKLASEGKVDFKTFQSAMEAGLGGAGQESGKTFTGAMKNAGAALGRLGASLMSGLFPQMKTGFGDVTALLDRMGPAAEIMGRKLGGAISWIANRVGAFVANFKAGEGAAGSLRSVLGGLFGFIRGTAIPAVSALGRFLFANREKLIALGAGVLVAVAAFKAFMFIKKVIFFVKAARLAMLAFNASLLANPIGLIVAAIAVLVAAFVYLYRNNDTARRIMQTAWRAIKAVIASTVNWFTKTAWPAMKKAFQNLSDVAKALWKNGIRPAFKGIGSIISWWYKNVVKRYFGLVKAIFQGAAASAKWLWKGGIKPAFSGIAAVVKWMWARIKANFALLRAGMGLVSAGAKKLYDKGIRPAFNSISSKASWLWGKAKWAFGKVKGGMTAVSVGAHKLYDKGIRPAFNSISDKAAWLWGKVKWAFDKIKAGAGAVKTAIGTAKDGIKKSWAKVYGAIKDPIVKALKWVQNTFVKKMRGFLGKIPGVSASLIPNISLKGFATGGWTGPGSKMQPAGVVHADEYVVNKKSRGRFERRNPGVLDHINRTGDMPGYAIGGKVAGLNLRFKKMLDQFNAAAGNRYSVNSGYRSNAHQQVLYNRYLAGRGPVAARPGSSQHNKGLAADLAPSNARDVHQGLARSMGLVFTVPSESWHIEPSWGRGSNAGPSSTGGGGGIGLPGWATNPLNWVKGKFKSIMGGFDKGKYGLAGEILPPVLGKLKGAVTKQLKSAAASLNPLSGGKASNFSFGKFKAGTNQVVGKQLAAQAGFTGGQWTALRKLWQKESNWDHKAMNGSSGAYGIPQSLPGSKMRSAGADWRTNPATQIKWGLGYIKDRYGNPGRAWAHSQRTNWYDQGGRVQPAVFDNGGTLAPGLNLVNNKLGKPEPLVRADQSRSVHITSGALKLDPSGRVYIEGVAEEVFDNRDNHQGMRSRMGVGRG